MMLNKAWWCSPLSSALGRQRRVGLCDFKESWATEGVPGQPVAAQKDQNKTTPPPPRNLKHTSLEDSGRVNGALEGVVISLIRSIVRTISLLV